MKEDKGTVNGKFGYATYEYREEFPKDSSYYMATEVDKYFNFSQNGEIFFGGALGFAWYENSYSLEKKTNGEIKFNGLYQGSVAYKNYYEKRISVKIDNIYSAKHYYVFKKCEKIKNFGFYR